MSNPTNTTPLSLKAQQNMRYIKTLMEDAPEIQGMTMLRAMTHCLKEAYPDYSYKEQIHDFEDQALNDGLLKYASNHGIEL